MAGALGDLVIALHADTAKFTSDMGRAAHISEREWNKVARHASDAGRAIGAAALIAGAAAAKMAADFIGAAADLDDMAEKTGASVENLSKLAQQAYISGTSLESVEGGLIRLGKALNANDEEAKKATKALDALGLKADDLKGKDTAQAMQIVAEALNKYTDSGKKTALAIDLLGKSGAQLLPFLKDMANDGELNARVTAKQAAEAEELGKSWRRLSNDAKGVGQAMALDLVPWMQKMIEQFREGIKQAGGFWEALRLFGTSNPFKSAGESIAGLTKSIESFKEARAELAGRGVDTSAQDKEIAALEKRLAFAKFVQRQEAMGLSGGDTPGEAQRFGLGGAKLPLNYESRAKAASSTKVAVDKSIAEAERAARAQLDIQKRLGEADLRAQQYFADEIRKIGEEETKDREKQIAEQIRMQQMDLDAMKDYAQQIEKMGKATDKTDDFAKSLGMTFSSAFEDAVIGGKKFRDVLNGIAQDIARIILRKQVTEPLANAIGKFDFGSIIKGVWGSGGFGTIDSGGAAVSSAMRSDVWSGSYATGTDYVPKTGLALVHQGEKIIPAGENRGSGVSVTNYNDFRGVDASVVAQLDRKLTILERTTTSRVRDAQRRTVS